MRPVTGALLLGALLSLAPSSARPAPWSEVFAAASDTVVFFGADGALVRAPFSLASRDTLWLSAGGERLLRVRVSPDGRRVAWLTRAAGGDTTRLWVDGPEGAVLRMRYFALEAQHYGRVHSEALGPSIEDPEARGARLVQPGAFMRRIQSNTLEWTPDSRAVVFGYNDGLAAVPADGGSGFIVSRALAVSLDALDPAPIFLVDAIVLREHSRYFEPQGSGGPLSESDLPTEGSEPAFHALELGHTDVMISKVATSGTYLLYPMAHRWRVFTASDLTRSRLWAASPGTVWWAAGSVIRAIRTADPNPTDEVHTAGAPVWLGYDDAHRSLVWAAGREVARRPEDGGTAVAVLRTAAPIRLALPSGTSGRVGLVAGDTLYAWDRGDDSVRRVGLAGLRPTALFEGPGGELLVATEAGRGSPPGLARAPAGAGIFAPLEVPAVKGGVFHAVAGGAWILLYDPGPRPPAVLQAFDVQASRWTAVENPGVSGWEPLEPR